MTPSFTGLLEEFGKRGYFPTAPVGRVRRTALRHVVETFFDGSAAQAVAALVDPATARVSSDELERIAKLIARVRKGGA